jgi:uncharacterized membrane protein YciS (DUF1049 family)
VRSVGKRGRTIFTIYAVSNVTIRIDGFEVKTDIIDFRSSVYNSMDQLSYSTYPLTLLLRGGQKVVLLKQRVMSELSERNFMWSLPINNDDQSSITRLSSAMRPVTTGSMLTWIIVFGALLGTTFIFFQTKDIIGELLSQYFQLKTTNLNLKQLERQLKRQEEVSQLRVSRLELINEEELNANKLSDEDSDKSDEVEENDSSQSSSSKSNDVLTEVTSRTETRQDLFDRQMKESFSVSDDDSSEWSSLRSSTLDFDLSYLSINEERLESTLN